MLAIPAALPPDDSIQRLGAQPSSDGAAFLALLRFCVMDKYLVHRFRRPAKRCAPFAKSGAL
jgi:hypothetical protein